MDEGRGRFSPETRLSEGNAIEAGRDGVEEGVGIWDLNGDLETRLLFLTCL